MNTDEILKSRNTTHGDYKEQAELTCRLLDVMVQSRNWQALPPMQSFGLIMIAGKIARMLTGDHAFVDHATDIAGYARLIERELEAAKETPNP